MRQMFTQRARRFNALHALLTGAGRSAPQEALPATDHLRRDTGLPEISVWTQGDLPRF